MAKDCDKVALRLETAFKILTQTLGRTDRSDQMIAPGRADDEAKCDDERMLVKLWTQRGLSPAICFFERANRLVCWVVSRDAPESPRGWGFSALPDTPDSRRRARSAAVALALQAENLQRKLIKVWSARGERPVARYFRDSSRVCCWLVSSSSPAVPRGQGASAASGSGLYDARRRARMAAIANALGVSEAVKWPSIGLNACNIKAQTRNAMTSCSPPLPTPSLTPTIAAQTRKRRVLNKVDVAKRSPSGSPVVHRNLDHDAVPVDAQEDRKTRQPWKPPRHNIVHLRRHIPTAMTKSQRRQVEKLFESVFFCMRRGDVNDAMRRLKKASMRFDPSFLMLNHLRRVASAVPQRLEWDCMGPLLDELIVATRFSPLDGEGTCIPAAAVQRYVGSQVRLVVQEFLASAAEHRERMKKESFFYLQRRGLALRHLRLHVQGNEVSLYGDVKALRRGRRGIQRSDVVGVSLAAGVARVRVNGSAAVDRGTWEGGKVFEAVVVDVTDERVVVRFYDSRALGRLPKLESSDMGVFRVDKLESRVTFERQLRALEQVWGCESTSGPRNQKKTSLAICSALAFCPAENGSEAVSPDDEMQRIHSTCDQVVRRVGTKLLNGLRGLDALNQAQKQAVVDGLCQRLTLVQGPPGTGKSHVACHILAGWAKLRAAARGRADERKGRRRGDRRGRNTTFEGTPCLATAGSNAAVDNLVEGLAAVGVNVVRVGTHSDYSENEVLRDHNLEYLAQLARERGSRSDERVIKQHILSECDVVCATCSGAGGKILERNRFHSVLVDESTQVTEPEVLIALSKGCRQLVLVGDHCQLEPTVISSGAKRAGLGVSLFEKLRRRGVKARLLNVQYRMHPIIAELPSDLFYGGCLRNGVTAQDRPLPGGFRWPRPLEPVAFIHVYGQERSEGDSIYNESEARRAVDVVVQFLNGGTKPHEIAVVTPYTSQKVQLRKLLRTTVGSRAARIEVSSVDGFQGREKEVIVISLVRANPQRRLGFLDNWRRVNVVLTRARRGLVVIGHMPTIQNDHKSWGHWLSWAISRGLVQGSLPCGHRGGYDRKHTQRIGHQRLNLHGDTLAK